MSQVVIKKKIEEDCDKKDYNKEDYNKEDCDNCKRFWLKKFMLIIRWI